MEMKAGMLVRSKAGHDKGKMYVIAGQDEAYVYLVDGSARKLANPKKKRKKHVQPVRRQYEISEADDGSIRSIVKDYQKETTPDFREE